MCVRKRFRAKDKACKLCTDGVDCFGDGNRLEKLHILPGFWRSSNSSELVLHCPIKEACPGSSASTDAAGKNTTTSLITRTGNTLCATGNEGVMCTLCSPRYQRINMAQPCKACGTPGEAIAWAIGGAFISVAGLVVLLYLNRKAPNGALRPFINFVQYISVMLMYNAPWPALLIQLFKVLQSLNMDVISFVSPSCAGATVNYYTKFSAMTGAMCVVIFCMWVPVLKALVQGEAWHSDAVRDRKGSALRDTFILVLLLHPTVSGEAFQLFRCRTIEGTTYLMADYSLHCYTTKWYQMLGLDVLVVVFFSFGAPAFVAGMLYRRRKDLKNENTVKLFGVLYYLYRDECYFYEAINMLFKVFLWSTLVFFEHGSEMQLACALVINVIQLCAHIYFRPFGGQNAQLLNVMQFGTLFLTTFINFGGLAMNYLKLAQTHYPEQSDAYDMQLNVLKRMLEIMTCGIIFCFCGVGIKGGVLFLRNNVHRLETVLPKTFRLRWNRRSEQGAQMDTGGVELGTMSQVEMVHEPAEGRRQGETSKWSVNPLMISSPADMVAMQTERRARGTNNKNNKETGAMRTDKTDNEGRRSATTKC